MHMIFFFNSVIPADHEATWLHFIHGQVRDVVTV
jgi:hypothetical protein